MTPPNVPHQTTVSQLTVEVINSLELSEQTIDRNDSKNILEGRLNDADY